jgi:hypothetical protein
MCGAKPVLFTHEHAAPRMPTRAQRTRGHDSFNRPASCRSSTPCR